MNFSFLALVVNINLYGARLHLRIAFNVLLGIIVNRELIIRWLVLVVTIVLQDQSLEKLLRQMLEVQHSIRDQVVRLWLPENMLREEVGRKLLAHKECIRIKEQIYV